MENFCVHSRNGYYNGHIFHRVIKVWAPVECLDVPLDLWMIADVSWSGDFSCVGLHDPDRRPHGHRDGWREHLGGRVWGRVSCHTEARQTLHLQHGQCGPGDQRVTVFHHCRPNCKSSKLLCFCLRSVRFFIIIIFFEKSHHKGWVKKKKKVIYLFYAKLNF